MAVQESSNRKRRHASKGKQTHRMNCKSKRRKQGKQGKQGRTQRRTRARRGGNMFHGSNATPPVVCLDGNSKIPCTAFSSA